jgi:hypothetical protein
MFDRKKVKLFFTFLFRVVKTAPPRAGASTPPPALVIKRLFMARKKKQEKKQKIKLSDMKFCFMKRLFPRPRLNTESKSLYDRGGRSE